MEKKKMVEQLYGEVLEDWDWLVNNKNALGFAEIEIEPKEFAKLIKNTYDVISAITEEIADTNTEHLNDYIQVIRLMSEYSAEWPSEDESEDCFFTVSRLLAKDLAIIGSYPIQVGTEKRIRIIYSEVADMWCYDKECKYNIDEGDFSEYIELAKSGVCP